MAPRVIRQQIRLKHCVRGKMWTPSLPWAVCRCFPKAYGRDSNEAFVTRRPHARGGHRATSNEQMRARGVAFCGGASRASGSLYY